MFFNLSSGIKAANPFKNPGITSRTFLPRTGQNTDYTLSVNTRLTRNVKQDNFQSLKRESQYKHGLAAYKKKGEQGLFVFFDYKGKEDKDVSRDYEERR